MRTDKNVSSKHRKVFPNADFMAHMPFFDGHTLMFCMSRDVIERVLPHEGTIWKAIDKNPRLKAHFADLSRQSIQRYQAWKLAHCSWKGRVPHRLETGLPEDGVECSPSFYSDRGRVHVSFIGGSFRNERLVYHLYTMTGPSFKRMGSAVRVSERSTHVGFVNQRAMCVHERGGLRITEHASGVSFHVEVPLIRSILRASYRPDDLDCLIVTGLDEWHRPLTLLARLDTRDIFEVSTSEAVYKSTIYGDQIVLAKRCGEKFEERELYYGPFNVVQQPGRLRVKRHDESALSFSFVDNSERVVH